MYSYSRDAIKNKKMHLGVSGGNEMMYRELDVLIETKEDYENYINNYLDDRRSFYSSILRFKRDKINNSSFTSTEFICMYEKDKVKALQSLFLSPIDKTLIRRLEDKLEKGDSLEDLFKLSRLDDRKPWRWVSSRLSLKERLAQISGVYPIKVDSWVVSSGECFTKYLDKSTFTQGSGIPKEIRRFFDIDNLIKGEKKYIKIKYDDRLYDAYFNMSREERPRTRLFWDSNFTSILLDAFPKYFGIVSNNKSVDIKYRPQLQLLKKEEYYLITLVPPSEEIDILKDSDITKSEDYIRDLDENIKQSRNTNREKRKIRLKDAKKKPDCIQIISKAYTRNADVIVEVLEGANGYCERCKAPAPFIRASDGTPYLEVHHRTPLSEGGEDTVENTIALCPNCHREVHFGIIN